MNYIICESCLRGVADAEVKTCTHASAYQQCMLCDTYVGARLPSDPPALHCVSFEVAKRAHEHLQRRLGRIIERPWLESSP